MDSSSDLFVEDLRSHYAARGKSLSEKVARLLDKDPLFFDAEDMEVYESLILPARGYIKHSLKEMMETDGMKIREWRDHLPRQPRTLIEGLVAEVLNEEETLQGKGPTTHPEKAAEGAEDPAARALEAKGSSRRKPAGTMGRRALQAMEWVVTIILALAILLAAFLMIAPRFGLQTHPVMSGSMEPSLKVGGLIICRKVPVSEVKVGDIIGYNSNYGQMVTHRVIDIVEEDGKRWFQTKGDANEDPDPDLITITEEKVDKVIFHVPYLGFFSRFMKTRLSFLIFICAPALILVVLFGRDLVVAIRETREKKGNRGSHEKSAHRQA